jgi:hypothetical protein
MLLLLLLLPLVKLILITCTLKLKPLSILLGLFLIQPVHIGYIGISIKIQQQERLVTLISIHSLQLFLIVQLWARCTMTLLNSVSNIGVVNIGLTLFA